MSEIRCWNTDATGLRCLHRTASKTLIMALWIFPRVLSSYSCRGDQAVYIWTMSFAWLSTFSHFSSFRLSEVVSWRMNAVSSEQRCATSCFNDDPIPLIMYFLIELSLRHLLAKEHRLPLASGQQSCYRLGVNMYELSLLLYNMVT